MVARVSVTVLPGSPELPESVEIVCSGLVGGARVGLLVDGVIVETFTAKRSGELTAGFRVTTAELKAALANMGGAGASMKEVMGRQLVSLGDGSHTIELRTG